jgi:hypothetical protein
LCFLGGGRRPTPHDIDVRLARSPRGGVTATVLLPERLVVASLPLRREAPDVPEADPPLPRRAPHASLAPDLAAGGPGHPVHPVRQVSPRSPEQVRTMLRRYRSGLERGRVAAARDLPDDPLP